MLRFTSAARVLRGASIAMPTSTHAYPAAGTSMFTSRNLSSSSATPSGGKDGIAGVSDEYFNRPGVWDDKNLASLFDANKTWANKMKADGHFAADAAQRGHAPKILWIGCSDSRVPANELIGEEPGNVFVHRNIANQVIGTDFNCMSVIQYAVDVLKVKHIIVCGHYDCGGVKAALTNNDHGAPLENWLRNIRDIHQHHFSELSAIPLLADRQKRLVELSTIEQCLNIFKTGSVQRRFSAPVLHAMVYDPFTGKLKKLEVDFKESMRTYSDVFNLYSVDRPKA
eukprot:GSChrysophyteH2.ASY1.ANO1.415.1 assembled CDS